MPRFLAAAAALALLLPPIRVDAGCICPELATVRVGDLDVTGATIKAQRWSVAADRVEVELDLTGASAATTIDVLAAGVTSAESQHFDPLARDSDGHPRAIATHGDWELTGSVSRSEGKVRVRWKLGMSAKHDLSVKIAWSFPHAGADADPTAKSLVKEFCIDAGTRKALKRADGYHRVDVVLSEDMAANLSLRVTRERLPVSLCAQKVKRLGKGVFEIRGRKNLQDTNGVLPILFGASI